MLRALACVLAALALASLVLLGVINAMAASRGEDAFGVLGIVSFVVGVGTPAFVGLFLIWQRPRTLVAWILLAGALSVGVVIAAFGVAAVAMYEDRDSALGAWALLLAQEWLVLFAWPLALAYVYPDGRLPSRRWRPMAAVALASCGGAMLLLLGQDVARGPVRRRAEPAGRRRERGARRRLLGLLGGRARLAVRRRAGAAGALQGGRPRPPSPGPVAGLRRAADSAVARRRVARARPVLADHRRRRAGAQPAARLAGRRRRGGRHAPRPVLDRPALQPHARLRTADRAPGRDVRRRRGRRRVAGGRLGAAGRARHAGCRARVPAAARPAPGPGRPALRPRALRGRPARARLARGRARGPQRAGGRRRRACGRARRPERGGALSPARDRGLRGPQRPRGRGAPRRRAGEIADRARRPRARGAAPRSRARPAAGPAARACSTPPG